MWQTREWTEHGMKENSLEVYCCCFLALNYLPVGKAWWNPVLISRGWNRLSESILTSVFSITKEFVHFCLWLSIKFKAALKCRLVSWHLLNPTSDEETFKCIPRKESWVQFLNQSSSKKHVIYLNSVAFACNFFWNVNADSKIWKRFFARCSLSYKFVKLHKPKHMIRF